MVGFVFSCLLVAPEELDDETEREGVKGILVFVWLRLWLKCIRLLLPLQLRSK